MTKTSNKKIGYIIGGITIFGLIGLFFYNKNKKANREKSKETFDLKQADTLNTKEEDNSPEPPLGASRVSNVVVYKDYPIQQIISPIIASESVLTFENPIPKDIFKVGDRIKIVTITKPNKLVDTNYVKVKKIATSGKNMNVSKMLKSETQPNSRFAIRVEKTK
jgi:hypothetical protein